MKWIYLLALILIPLASADLGSFEQNKCVAIKTILNSSAANISSIALPNTTTFYLDEPMTKNAKTFNYTFCVTDLLGVYIYDYYDSEGNTFVNTFEITYTGDRLTNSLSLVYLGLLAILSALFVLALVSIQKLPKNNNVSDDGWVVSVNNLKYFRPILWAVSYVLLVAIIFLTANIAIAYLPGTMFGTILFKIFQILGWMMIPAAFLWFIFLFAQIFRDRETKSMLERGVGIKDI